MRLAWLLVSFFVNLVFLRAIAPDATWEDFGSAEGLSGSSVTAVVQDEDGFLWFSTQSGLNRWDGYTMKVWQKEPFSTQTLSNNLIQTMTLDAGHVLWLGTYGGLDRFDTHTETFRAFRHVDGDPTSLSHNVVTRVYRDQHGVLWVGTLDGLNRLEEGTGAFRGYRFVEGAPGLSGKTIRSLVEDPSGRLWVGSSGGLDWYDRASDRLVPYSMVFPGRALPPGAVMGALRLPGSSHLWLGVWGQGLVDLDPSRGTWRLVPLSDNRIFGLTSGEGGELHVATWGGGLVVLQSTGEQVTFQHDSQRRGTLAHNVVYTTFQDRGGLVWVATNGGGLSRYNPRRDQFQYVPTGGKAIALLEDRQGRSWVGIYNQGVAQWGPQGVVRSWRHDPQRPQSLPDDIVNGLVEGPDGRLWATTNAGLAGFDPQTGVSRRLSQDASNPDRLPDEVVTAQLWDGHSWWIGTYRGGVVRRSDPLRAQGQVVYQADSSRPGALPDNLVYFVQKDREGRLWVGTNGGLALYRPETDDFRVWTYHEDQPDSLPSNNVRCLWQDSQGRLWVGTNGGGVSLLDPESGRLRTLGLREGLTSLSVYAILEDERGNLWISTANGLFSYQPQSQVMRRFGVADGLPTAEFSSGAWKKADGTLQFGATQGVVSLRPRDLLSPEAPPLVALTGIQVLRQKRPVSDRVSLGWQENSVTFSFATLDFRNPSKNLYAYRLEGFDADWVEAGTRNEATYTNLWPGTYRFRVRGATATETWAEASRTVLVTVEAAPWASWYAALAYVALLVTLVYLYQRARLSQALAVKVNELEALRAQLEDANHQLERLARLDGLTGIPNRRALDTWLEAAWARALRRQESLAMLLIDIDEFKRYNDCYGHLAGDACLRAVAQSLSGAVLRTTDFCARYGGEEFLIVLADTDLEGAATVATRLVAGVDALGMVHEQVDTGHVTISVGIAAVVPTSDRVADLVQRADTALYKAKAAGRHRVES